MLIHRTISSMQERVNSVALFNVKVKHPQEVTVEIGSGYFAEMTANQAIALYQRRLKSSP